jgi:hypothetical protein
MPNNLFPDDTGVFTSIAGLKNREAARWLAAKNLAGSNRSPSKKILTHQITPSYNNFVKGMRIE